MIAASQLNIDAMDVTAPVYVWSATHTRGLLFVSVQNNLLCFAEVALRHALIAVLNVVQSVMLVNTPYGAPFAIYQFAFTNQASFIVVAVRKNPIGYATVASP